MPKKTYGLFFAFIVIFWVWMDFIGLLLSTLSTYFYFGWENVPYRIVWIFLIALFALSGPIAYRLLCKKIKYPWFLRSLLILQLGLYLLLGFYRQSDFFAWGVVFGCFLSSLLAIAALTRLHHFPGPTTPLHAFLFSALFYNLSRVFLHGTPILFSDSLLHMLPLILLTALAIMLPHYPLNPSVSLEEMSRTGEMYRAGRISVNAKAFDPKRYQRKPWYLQFYVIAFGLNVGLSVAILYNLPLWSSKTPSVPTALYFYSFGIGSLIGLLFSRNFLSDALGLFVLLACSLFGIGNALYIVLYAPYSLGAGLMAHASGCFGVAILWYLFFRRYHQFCRSHAGDLPTRGLQFGFIAFLFVLIAFMLFANPLGFWLALIVSIGIMSAVEILDIFDDLEEGKAFHWILRAAFLICLLPGIYFVLPINQSPIKQPKTNVLTILSSNIRYGWTNDSQFRPFEHLRWLQKHPVNVLGLQEVNKGHTAGAYLDLYHLYQAHIPGRWRYGDANFGFGNAIRSDWPILASKRRPYQQSAMLKRSCLWTLINIHGQEVEVFLTHLSHLPKPSTARKAQSKQLANWLKKTKRPWILLGDLNAKPDEQEFLQLLQLAHPILRGNPQFFASKTYPAQSPSLRLDYILFSKHFRLHKMKVLDNGSTTDHRPVYAEIELPRKGNLKKIRSEKRKGRTSQERH